MELEVSVEFLSIQKIRSFLFYQKQTQNLRFKSYFDTDNLLVKEGPTSFVVNKSKMAQLKFLEFHQHQTGFCEIGKYQECRALAHDKHSSTWFGSKLLLVGNSGVELVSIPEEQELFKQFLSFQMSHKIDFKLYFQDLIKLYHVAGVEFIVKILFQSLFLVSKKNLQPDQQFQNDLKKKYSLERSSIKIQDETKESLHILMFIKLFNQKLNENPAEERVKDNHDYLDLLFIQQIFEKNHNLLLKKLVLEQDQVFCLDQLLISSLYKNQFVLVDYLKTFYLTETLLRKEEDFLKHFHQFHQRLVASIPFLPKALKNKTQHNKVVPNQIIVAMAQNLQNTLDLLQYLNLSRQAVDQELLKQMSQFNLQELIQSEHCNYFFRRILFKKLDTLKNQTSLFQKFFSEDQIRALQLISSYEHQEGLYSSSNSFLQDDFIAQLSTIEYHNMEDYAQLFFQRGHFLLFIQILTKRLQNMVVAGQLNQEQSLIEQFLLQTLLLLLKPQKTKEKLLIRILGQVLNGIKKKIEMQFWPVQEEKEFNLEKKLTMMNREEKEEILKKFVPLLFKFPSDVLRERCLKLLFNSQKTTLINESLSQEVLQDIQQLSSKREIFKGEFGRQNANFVLSIFIQQKKYSDCLLIILSLFNNSSSDSFHPRYRNFESLFFLMRDDLDLHLEQAKQVRHIPLDELKNYLHKGNQLVKKLNQDENKQLIQTFNEAKKNLHLNFIVKRELENKLEGLNKIKKTTSYYDAPLLQKYETFLQFQIIFMDINPLFSVEKVMQRIVGENKLYFALIEIQHYLSRDQYYDCTSTLLSLLKHYGRFNCLSSLSFIQNHFAIKEVEQEHFIVLSKQKSVQIQDLVDNNLIYPMNLNDKIHEYLALVYSEDSEQANLLSVLKVIEKNNLNNQYFKDMMDSLASVEFNEVMSRSMWHFYFFEKIFREEQVDKYCSIFKVLHCYHYLFKEQGQEESQNDNLKCKYINNFAILFEFTLKQVKGIAQKQEPHLGEKVFVAKFTSQLPDILNYIQTFKTFQPQSIKHDYNFVSQFRLKEQLKNLENISKSLLHLNIVQKIRQQVLNVNQFKQLITITNLPNPKPQTPNPRSFPNNTDGNSRWKQWRVGIFLRFKSE